MTKGTPYFKTPKVEVRAALVFQDGFNIYQMVSRMKKELKRSAPFPDDVILRFCVAYWRSKPAVKNSWAYFTKTFVMVSAQYHAQKNEAEGNAYKKAAVPESIREIMKGMF